MALNRSNSSNVEQLALKGLMNRAIHTFDDEPCVRAVSIDLGACDTPIAASVVDLSVVQSQNAQPVVDAQSRVAVRTEGQAVLEPAHG